MALAGGDLGFSPCEKVEELAFVFRAIVFIDADEDGGSASPSSDDERLP
jgi:hypothetical protein